MALQQQEQVRHSQPQKPDMSINLISCAPEALGEAAQIEVDQEREKEWRARDMQGAPDEPSELLVKPAEKLTCQNTIQEAERSSLEHVVK